MDAPTIVNKTDFAAAPRTLMSKEGERLVVIVKGTFAKFSAQEELECVSKVLRRGIRGQDIPWGNPEKSSIKYPSDLCIAKPGTDVIVVAAAHAPGGKAVPFFDAGLQVGTLEKVVRIFGPRVWGHNGSSLSSPRPTLGTEIRYDYAWGGLDDSDPMRLLEEARNPVGTGVTRDVTTLTHTPAPCVEDPGNLLVSVQTKPAPAGLGAIGRHWVPRRHFLGNYGAAWLRERAPLLPLDHDDRSNLCASTGLTAVSPLSGGEKSALWNLTPGGGTLKFALPRVHLTITLQTKEKEPQSKMPYLDTVLIDTLRTPEDSFLIVEMVWRAAFTPPRRLKDAKLTVNAERHK